MCSYTSTPKGGGVIQNVIDCSYEYEFDINLFGIRAEMTNYITTKTTGLIILNNRLLYEKGHRSSHHISRICRGINLS